LSSEQLFETIITGLPIGVVDGYRRALAAQKADLQEIIEAYEAAKDGNYSELKRRAGNDPGISLIIARISCGYSQKDLARRLGLKEQQIQRYEADRYRSISLSNFRRVAHVLGVKWEMRISEENSQWFGDDWRRDLDFTVSDIKKVIKHAREYKWFEDDFSEISEEESQNYIHKYISNHILSYGAPTLLRTGLNVVDQTEDLLLVAWKARVIRIAEKIIEDNKVEYSGLGLTWLSELVQLSVFDDGPARACKFLLSRGIVLVAEPQIPGLKLDGAAFLVGNVPVIGMTLRRDTVDNFWFTLLHEVGHIVLHFRAGLRLGFFDDTENNTVDEIEEEANSFASNMLVPEEKWRRTPARISKSPDVIAKFAGELGIHPAIVFGRIQKERKDYAFFSNKIGRGSVRKWLINT